MDGPRMPPCTANIGQACYACFKEELSDGVTLQKCTMCHMVQYCGPACQKKDWSKHKIFCKVSHQTEKSETVKSMLLSSLADAPATDLENLEMLNKIAATIVQTSLQHHQFISKMTPTIAEQNLYSYEPRCMACARTDRLMRMEASRNKSSSSPNMLKACSNCKMAFYCSDAHWKAVQHFHAGEPCIDGHDGLSQCQVNREIRADIAFANFMAGAKAGNFKWAPERVKSSWTSLNGISWEKEFSQELAQFFSIPVTSVGPWIRSASEPLSLPMSILWALENLNEDDAWTRQDTLVVHMIGAHELEIMNAQILEEILHRLPAVKVLKLVLCGPQISEIASSEERDRVIDMETCPNCQRQGRKRLHIHHDKTYHDYAKSMGTTFKKPDLAIAFNSGCSQAASSWKETIVFLMQNNIPSVFTSYNREEAEADAAFLKSTGVNLNLGPMKNKWGSLMAKCEPCKVTGFYSVNGWLAGGFR